MVENKHILVVDDEQSVCDLLSDVLEEEGYIVTATRNGIEAFEFISEGNIVDLIISDIRMPGMGGFKLLDKIKEKNPFPPPVIFITGYSDITPEEAFSHGAIAYLKKPMAVGDIIRVVQNAFEGTPLFKRKYERVDTRLQVRISTKENNEGVNARVLNISQGGVFVATDYEVPEGASLELEIFFNEGKPQLLCVAGEVVWRRTATQGAFLPGFGVKFNPLAPEIEEFLAKYVEEKKDPSKN